MTKTNYKLVIKDITDFSAGSFVLNGVTFRFDRQNTQRNEDAGIPNKVANHWEAGARTTLSDCYNFNITEVNGITFVFKTLKWSEKGQHLYKRNTSSIGTTLCCMDKPSNTPSENMLDALAILCSEVCAWKKLIPSSKIDLPKIDDGVFVGGMLQAPVVADHRFYSDADNYGRESKVDIGKYQAPVLANTIKYFQALKRNERQFIFTEILKSA